MKTCTGANCSILLYRSRKSPSQRVQTLKWLQIHSYKMPTLCLGVWIHCCWNDRSKDKLTRKHKWNSTASTLRNRLLKHSGLVRQIRRTIGIVHSGTVGTTTNSPLTQPGCKSVERDRTGVPSSLLGQTCRSEFTFPLASVQEHLRSPVATLQITGDWVLGRKNNSGKSPLRRDFD